MKLIYILFIVLALTGCETNKKSNTADIGTIVGELRDVKRTDHFWTFYFTDGRVVSLHEYRYIGADGQETITPIIGKINKIKYDNKNMLVSVEQSE